MSLPSRDRRCLTARSSAITIYLLLIFSTVSLITVMRVVVWAIGVVSIRRRLNSGKDMARLMSPRGGCTHVFLPTRFALFSAILADPHFGECVSYCRTRSGCHLAWRVRNAVEIDATHWSVVRSGDVPHILHDKSSSTRSCTACASFFDTFPSRIALRSPSTSVYCNRLVPFLSLLMDAIYLPAPGSG